MTTRSSSAAPRSLPVNIWLPAQKDAGTAVTAPAVLPPWVIDRIRREFTNWPGRLPASLLCIRIGDTGAGMDARTPATRYAAEDTNAEDGQPHVLLAELHPDTLPSPGDDLIGSEIRGALDDGWPGFFHRAHRLLPEKGILLLGTRQRRVAGRLTDPLGLLIASARTAGFTYRQHIVVVHAHMDGNELVPSPPADAPPGLIHSDLPVLSRTAA